MKKVLIIGKASKEIQEYLKTMGYELVFQDIEKDKIKGMEFNAVFINEVAPFDYNKIPRKRRKI